MFKRALLAALLCGSTPAFAQSETPVPDDVDAVFTDEYRNELVMDVEAAFAQAQADYGYISQEAADEIARTASIEYAPLEDVSDEYSRVRHRMVALLNVWRRVLSEDASNALHRGVTTVDVYDTVRILQIRQTIALLRADLVEAEGRMIALAREHRDTPMVGRTLGQHALPITFGKKVATWAAANRRNIERLDAVACRVGTLGVLRGAVGTHLGLGPDGPAMEIAAADYLGLGPVTPADWHGLRDVFGEYASVLAIMSRTQAHVGQEVFLMQMTDIGELYERRISTAVSSSSMPHKINPSRSEQLMHAGRVIPAISSILIDDVANYFERDNTSRPNSTIEDISLAAGEMTGDLNTLLDRLVINPDRMRANLESTDGMVLAQRIVFAVEDELGKEAAEEHVAEAANHAQEEGIPFREALLADDRLAPLIAGQIDELLDFDSYLGASAEQVDATIAWLEAQPQEAPACAM
ncbi:lyase family protein [Aurantiacibacter sp. MUD61]|uniref:lyase family protein n=1 Tax=Aurantiacibacter sp. MUD61 TaxID=3009083 RepID=UPI0022F09D84|nr:lyase family protein [Aurantiacibacter sp. MUD61]